MDHPAVAIMRKLLNDPTYSDLTIKVGKDEVRAHRCVIALRCENILPMPDFNDKKKKIKDKQSVTIKESGVSAKEIQKVLEYLYTGQVQFPKMNYNDILTLSKAAKSLQLKRLTYMCEQYLRDVLSMDNIFDILKAAHNLQEPTIESFAKSFALGHYAEFVSNKQGLHILGLDLFQEVVTAFQTFASAGGPGTPTIGDPPEDTLFSDLRRMFDTMPFADVKFNFEGEQISCHKAILSAWSEKFKANLKEAPPSGVQVRLTAEGFKQMIRFLYYGDDNIEPLPACELVGYARSMDLGDLVTVCENKIRNSISVQTVLDILKVAYSPDMAQKQDLVEELKSKTWPFIMDHFTEIDLLPLRGMLKQISQDLLLKVQEHQRKKKRGGR